MKVLILILFYSLITLAETPSLPKKLEYPNKNCKNLFADLGILYTNPEYVREQNEKVLSLLSQPLAPLDPQSKRRGEINQKEAQEIYQAVKNHPVASLSQINKYDPDGGTGFCFGRACTTHFESLFVHQIDNSRIAKLFVTGNLRTGNSKWRYHVTTIVKASGNEGWWAIDPIFDRPMSAKEWFEEMKKFDTADSLKLFITEAKRVGPDGSEKYPPSYFKDRYHNYFKDLLEYYKKINRSKSLRSKRD